MEFLNGVRGIGLNDEELEIWARANVSPELSASIDQEDLEAVAAEHTGRSTADPEVRTIELVDFERASKILGRFISHLDSSDSFESIETAIQLREALTDGTH
jgi:CRISPR/Cas system CSM-associated protein Csm4 (group 5 of RAMP superfamily)